MKTAQAKVFYCIAFAIIMTMIPWESITGRSFEDLEVYKDRFDSESIADDASTPLSYISNEIVWQLAINYLSTQLGVDSGAAFKMISIISLFTFSMLLTNQAKAWNLLLLINPLVIDFCISQVRMALAMSIVYGAINRRSYLMIPMLAIAFLTHTATILFVAFIAISKIICQNNKFEANETAKKLIIIATGVLTGLLIGPLRQQILEAVGDRRAVYEAPPTSLGYASFWIIILISIMMQNKKYFRNPSICTAAICLTTFTLGVLFNIQSTRFLSAVFPLITIAYLRLDPQTKAITIPIGIGYITIQWFLWL